MGRNKNYFMYCFCVCEQEEREVITFILFFFATQVISQLTYRMLYLKLLGIFASYCVSFIKAHCVNFQRLSCGRAGCLHTAATQPALCKQGGFVGCPLWIQWLLFREQCVQSAGCLELPAGGGAGGILLSCLRKHQHAWLEWCVLCNLLHRSTVKSVGLAAIFAQAGGIIPVQAWGKVTHLAAHGYGLELQLSIFGISEVCWAACQVERIASPEQVISQVTSGLAGWDAFLPGGGALPVAEQHGRGRDGAAGTHGSAFSLALNEGAEQLQQWDVYC